ncbi:TPA: 3-deoxy-manno-octulosonate cytidylyltransferase [Vibrio parahaemolyticus]|uniref:3-deoxy-manno-octulosonate cytidylyltransferase n=2 Tax=Vibrio harveyi group TaxID=717610 RepID=UPI003AB02B3F|nr:3-deoxy-manno-octulosonate cytidylyltransferase [Vibrio parahaemolyticus]HCG6646776.1 3-deoxy-manno-octulosonate cytidylyltransferase [Vibrio parahaemolyticus]
MTNEKNFAVVIPARYKSSRFPGKPLVDICGKPMIQHVWERCCLAVGQEKVYVATDDSRIQNVVESFGGQVVMTSSDCLTGTDRLAEANLQLNCDFIVNVQGDEPLINPEDINTVIEAFLKSGNVTNAMCVINSEQEFRSFTVPKVTFSQSGKLLYMSRAGIPQTKTGEYKFGYKQVCIYAFSKEQLAFFYSNKAKTRHEQVEDIEILRFLESDYVVDMVEVEAGSLAVDVPTDVKAVITKLTSSS